MEDLRKERSQRLHSDFLDQDGEYEVLSSLLTNKYYDQSQHQDLEEEYLTKLNAPSNLEDLIAGNNNTNSGYLFYSYIQVIWSVMFLGVIAWISFRWMDLDLDWLYKKWWNKGDKNKGTPSPNSSTGNDAVCTKATAKAFSHGNNLSSQFEQIMVDQKEETVVISSSCKPSSNTRNPSNILKVGAAIETTRITVTQTHQQKEAVKMSTCIGTTLLEDREEENDDSGVDNSSSNDNNMTIAQSNSAQSPPQLIDDDDGEPLEDLLRDTPSKPQSTDCPRSAPAKFRSFSRPITPMLEDAENDGAAVYPIQSQPSASPPDTPLKFDASLGAVLPYTSSLSSLVELTPEELAIEFVQNVEIIGKVLSRSSSTKLNSSLGSTTAAFELAMMHQSSHMKSQQQQQHMAHQERQQSSIRHNKYDEYLKDLSQAKEQCLQACSFSINYSVMVCVVLEGSRHAAGLMDTLEYFSVKEAGAIVLHMACGCEDSQLFESDEPPSGSYIYSMSTFFLSTLESSMVKFADYASCAIAYAVVLVGWQIAHTMLRALHCPTLLHQILNGVVLVVYLAQNPGAWIVVTRNLELYYLWVKVQSFLSIISFSVTMVWHVRTRSYLLERQQQIQGGKQSRDNYLNQIIRCDARHKIAHMEDLSWMITLVPSMILGMVVLSTVELSGV